MNLESEDRNGYLVSADMKKIWAIQMELVQKLLDVCKKHNLQIWAEAGTLLGMVRHQGYIPWDDDIDMLMFRPDYDKLLSLAKDEFHSPYFLQCAYTEKSYSRGHAQLRKDGTAAILPDDIHQNFHQGIFIDIFVYDAVPDIKDEDWNQRFRKADKIMDILYTAHYCELSYKSISYSLHVLNCILYSKWKGERQLFHEYENLFNSYDFESCSCVACPCFNRKAIKSFTKKISWYRQTIMMPFEDIMLPAPIDFDKVLRTQYGDDYMTPKQVSSLHGGFAAISVEKSYIDIIKDLRKINRKQCIDKILRKLHIK